MSAEPFICDRCGKRVASSPEGTGAGYGVTRSGAKHCYACCADTDRAEMVVEGIAVLYLVERGSGMAVTNWPGSLIFPVLTSHKSDHNIAGRNGRTDVWFAGPDGHVWHGVNIGHHSQIARVRRTKERLVPTAA